MKQFEGKVAVITGGASGFGKEFARIGAQLGMKLVLADVQEDALDTTVAEFKAQGVQVIGLRTDVSKAEQVQALADATMTAFGEVHLLFNNAGIGAGGNRIGATSIEQLEYDIDAYSIKLSDEIVKEVNAIHAEFMNPGQ